MLAGEHLYEPLWRFRAGLRSFHRFSEEHCAKQGCTPAIYHLLLALRPGAKREIDIGNIANALALKHHSAAELVHRAAKMGLVAKHRDPQDGRRTLLRLTDDGQETLAELAEGHAQELRRIRDATAEVLRQI